MRRLMTGTAILLQWRAGAAILPTPAAAAGTDVSSKPPRKFDEGAVCTSELNFTRGNL